ncbi:MAG: hypothetical protein KF861_18455 [Planctomycetaceae bacterium]|nr:hypothetical protein [Planctomycetaceae bacterium]
MNSPSTNCAECGGEQFTANAGSISGAAYDLLPGLGGFIRAASFDVIVCEGCGLTRIYADQSAREKLRTSPKWRPVE